MFSILRTHPHRMAVVCVASIVSVGKFLYYYRQGLTLLYTDAQSHLLIAKRVIDSPTPGFAQLGNVWPVIQHVLMLPLIWSDTLFETGIAGSAISMIFFVLTALVLHETTSMITGDLRAGVVTGLVFVMQPDVGYMQATAMSELPLLFFTALSVYYLLCWSRDPENHIHIFRMSVALILATLTRYEGWILLGTIFVSFLFICYRYGYLKVEKKMEAFLLFFLPSFVGVLGWVVWNGVIVHDPLYFMRGEYAKPSLWVGENDKAVGNVWISIQTYFYAIYEILGWALIAVALLALVYFIYKTRFEQETLGLYVLLFPVVFFPAMLYMGQRPLHVEQINSDLYNVRFALQIVLIVAILVGYLVAGRVKLQAAIIIPIILLSAYQTYTSDIVTLEEPLGDVSTQTSAPFLEVSDWLEDNYSEGRILMEGYGNDEIQFRSGLPIQETVYEGSFRLWDRALVAPHNHVEWIVMRGEEENFPSDLVWQELHGTSLLLDHFVCVYSNGTIEVYNKAPSEITSRCIGKGMTLGTHSTETFD